MDQSSFNLKLNDGKNFSMTDVANLNEITSEYPYFGIAWVLHAKSLYTTKSINFTDVLGKASMSVNSTDILFKEVFTKNTAPKPEQKPERAIVEAKEIHAPEPISEIEGETINNKDDLREIVKRRLLEIEKDKLAKEAEPIQSQLDSKSEELILPVPIDEKEILVEEHASKTSESIEVDVIAIKSAETIQEKPIASLEEHESQIDIIVRERNLEKDKRLIDKFIKNDPSVSKPKDDPYVKIFELAKKSLEDRMDFVSETLAVIYFKQGNNEMAKKIYEQLILKVPEKKLYFAAQIQKIIDNQ